MNREILVKELLIKDFIRRTSRAPTRQEINFLYNDYLRTNPGVKIQGINAGATFKFNQQANKESSANNFNETINSYLLEQNAVNASLQQTEDETEALFRMYNNKFSEELRSLKKMTKIINKNLLLHSKDDIYTNGIVESFQDYDKINFDQSNIYMFNGKVTLGFRKVAGENFDSSQITYRVTSRTNSKLIHRNLNNISATLNEDGTFFKVLAFSEIKDDPIDFYIDLDFNTARSIDTLKFTTQAVESNSKIDYRCYYSRDQTNYIEAFESALVVENNENYIEINQDGVRAIRLILSKNGYDYIDGDQFVYIFNLDFLGGTTKRFTINKDSVLSLGPYELLDLDDEPVNFTMATLKGGTCCIVPDRTSIDFYLSKDNLNWYKTDFDATSKQVVQFEENVEPFDGTGLFELYNDNLNASSGSFDKDIVEDYAGLNINILPHQRLLKYYIKKDKFKDIVKESLIIKRNFCKKQNKPTYSAHEGWYKSSNNYYHTLINMTEPEGRYLDFGINSCFLNGKQISGKQFIPFGVHEFKTSEENYKNLNLTDETALQNEQQLQAIDMLYPYNHKYVVEGFRYSSTFSGKQLYVGADEIFSYQLKEVSNQRFLTDTSLENYTFVDVDFKNENDDTINAVFIMINIKSNSSEGKLEDYVFECKKRNTIDGTSNNKLFIKAILKSLDPRVTPKIDQIQVRVI